MFCVLLATASTAYRDEDFEEFDEDEAEFDFEVSEELDLDDEGELLAIPCTVCTLTRLQKWMLTMRRRKTKR